MAIAQAEAAALRLKRERTRIDLQLDASRRKTAGIKARLDARYGEKEPIKLPEDPDKLASDSLGRPLN